jgi:predicted lipoprotein with Yx(FWY)xxD motif
MTRVPLLSAAAIGLTALAVVGCGGSSSYKTTNSSSQPAAKPASSAAGAPLVRTAKTSLGTVVVDGRGRTLYLFAKDAGPKSACSGGCATDWPPFTATATPKTAGGIAASALKLVSRSDGQRQVVLDGHPLYFYVGDQSAGQTNGQGVDAFGAKWFALDAAGKRLTGAASSAPKTGYSNGY